MTQSYVRQAKKILQEVISIARLENKLTGFCIGNTRKIDPAGMYFSPIRNTTKMVAGSAIVYNVDQALEFIKIVDGMVDYVLIDSEKKISSEFYDNNNIGNVERAIREVVTKSKILTYKGNDITVDAMDCFVVELLTTHPRGIGGKSAGIIGAGNVGTKLALKLVERGMSVSLFRRNTEKLNKIVEAINYIKPEGTLSRAYAANDEISASLNADLLIGLTHGIPVINCEMINVMSSGGILIDGGKGCIEKNAIVTARKKKISIYRTDIRIGFEGYVSMGIGRRIVDGVSIISGGLLADRDEIVVDNVSNPKIIYGVANGVGDFYRELNHIQNHSLDVVQNYINSRCIK